MEGVPEESELEKDEHAEIESEQVAPQKKDPIKAKTVKTPKVNKRAHKTDLNPTVPVQIEPINEKPADETPDQSLNDISIFSDYSTRPQRRKSLPANYTLPSLRAYVSLFISLQIDV